MGVRLGIEVTCDEEAIHPDKKKSSLRLEKVEG